jgi:hypothetical protein
MKDSNTAALYAAFVPWALVLLVIGAFMYLAPCGCMGGCSPANTPNRCQSGGGR